MPRLVDPKVKKRYFHLRYKLGLPRAQAAKEAGVSYTWAQHHDGLREGDSSGKAYRDARRAGGLPSGPIPFDKLSPEASQALGDFEYFRRRYFGHVSAPWQVEAANLMVEALASPHKEFLVLNCPPGGGKTTLFSHDIPAWLTVRDRSIRGLIGSHTLRVSQMYTGRLKKTMERTLPVQAKDRERQLGLAVDAEASLVADFGPFRPLNPDIWTREAFTVEQFGETFTDEKESTWTSFGMDSAQIGWRVNYIVWDDVVTPKVLRSLQAIENQRGWWDDESETRLEPTGVLVLQGQRLGASDLYRYCLDKEIVADDADEFDDDAPRLKQYRHIVYKAHYPDRCENRHHPAEAKPFPEGCLLDPLRLPWRDLRAVRAKGQKFQVLYQQEDVDPEDVLVPMLWVTGGRGADGVDHPGCWDKTRGSCELPPGLELPLVSVVTCDPSPTKFWSIQHWVYQPSTEQRFLMDLVRQAMDAPDFLDFDPASGVYTGLLDEWWLRSRDLGRPFTHLIVEANAAQRFMLQYSHFKRWAALRKVLLIPHQTTRNKLDPEFGVVASLKPAWRYGRVRLPGKQPGDPGRFAAMKLVDEVTRYPGGQTDDCVMAQWFLEYHLGRIVVPDRSTMPRVWRPSWWRTVNHNEERFRRLVALDSGSLVANGSSSGNSGNPEPGV